MDYTKTTQQLRISDSDCKQANGLSIDKLNGTIIYLTTKFTLTHNICYANAVYRHLCLLSKRYNTNPEKQFLTQSLIMDWYAICQSHKKTLPLNINLLS